MKSILLLALSAIILSQSYGFAYAEVPIITIETDSSSYEEGEVITISGSVSDFRESDPYTNFDVTIRLIAPNNNIVSISQVSLDDGFYSTSILAQGPLWKLDGDYTVSVSQGSDRNASTTFTFIHSAPEEEVTTEVEAEAAEAAEAAEQAAAEAVVMAAPREPAIDLVDTLSYNISGGSVSSIITNSDDATLVVAVDASDDGELSITMKGNYITAFDDDSYFVLVNNEEVWFSQDGSTLTIPFEAGTEKIEIVGSAVVPEFGTIAMAVLAVAIISIIVITAKTKTQLIPKL